jgi:hypothetical protein
MSTQPVEPTRGAHRELPADQQLRRARPWTAADRPVVEDLTDAEEDEFLSAITD